MHQIKTICWDKYFVAIAIALCIDLSASITDDLPLKPTVRHAAVVLLTTTAAYLTDAQKRMDAKAKYRAIKISLSNRLWRRKKEALENESEVSHNNPQR